MVSIPEFLFGSILGAAIVCCAFCGFSKYGKREIRGYLDLINLTPDQRHAVEEIRQRFLPHVAGIRKELRRYRMYLAALLFTTPLDRDQIRAAVKEISQLQLRLEQEVIDHILEEKILLTPEQQHQFHRVIVQQFRSGGLGIHDVQKNRQDR